MHRAGARVRYGMGASNLSLVPCGEMRDLVLWALVPAPGHLRSLVPKRMTVALTVSMSVAFQAATDLLCLSPQPLLWSRAMPSIAPLAEQAVESGTVSRLVWEISTAFTVLDFGTVNQSSTTDDFGTDTASSLGIRSAGGAASTISTGPALLWVTDESGQLLAPSGLALTLFLESQGFSVSRLGSSFSWSPPPNQHRGLFTEHYRHQGWCFSHGRDGGLWPQCLILTRGLHGICGTFLGDGGHTA